MTDSRLWAVVPVKPFACAKQRLAPLLGAGERAALARAMFTDVLEVVLNSPCLGGTLVITSDGDAAVIARRAGAAVLPETPAAAPRPAGLVQAVRQAARVLAAERAAGMLVVPADLPSIQRSDIERIALGHGSAPTVTLVGAAKDGGTNALACSPPDLLPICFGDDSFRRHHAASMALGVVPKIPVLPRFGRDIDRPGDLYAFLEQPSTTRAFAYLTDSGIARRLLELRELPGLRKLPEPRLPQRAPERAPTCFSAFTFGATAALSPE